MKSGVFQFQKTFAQGNGRAFRNFTQARQGANDVKKEETIILYDSPEAARLLTPEDLVKTPVWVSRPGNGKQVITTDEHIARYAGCAHQTCTETGEIFPKEIRGFMKIQLEIAF